MARKKYTPAQKKAYARRMARKRKFSKKRKYNSRAKSLSLNKVMSKMCITKIHQFTGLEELRPFGTSVNGVDTANWWMFDVAALARNNGGTATIDNTLRESSRIYFKNVRINLNFLPNRQCYAPLQYRYFFGYFKGDDNAGTSSLTASTLTSIYPKLTTNLKNKVPGAYTTPSAQDIYVKYQSKVFTMTPKMVYDANGSDDNQTSTEIVVGSNALTEGAEPMRGVWLPRSHRLNFMINRQMNYESADGDSLNGWQPFFAIQCIGIEYPFTKPNVPTEPDRTKWGNFPCPRLQADITSYFCDIH